MNRRARVFLVAPLALLLAFLVLATAPGPAAGYPTRTVYDRKIVASGAGPITAGDVNGDGLTDLVAVDDGAGTIQVFLQGGAGLPGGPSTAIQGLVPRKVLLADVDRDGRTDLVEMGSNSTRIDYQDAPGFVGRTQEVPTVGPVDLAVGDLTGDGLPDLAVAREGDVGVWVQRANGSWSRPADVTLAAPGFQAIEAADLNRDGHADLVLAKPFNVTEYLQDPEGGLNATERHQWLNSSWGDISLRVGDLNGDGRPDLVVTEVVPRVPVPYGKVTVLLQEAGAFTASSVVEGALRGWTALGDVNDDGIADLVVADAAPFLDVFLQKFTGGFDAAPTFQLAVEWTAGASGIEIGRFTGRPFADIVARTPGSLYLYEQEDAPPVLLRTIPSDFVINEGASGAGLIDLRNYFADDHRVLRFAVVYEEMRESLHATLAADGYHLDFAAAPGWHGTAQFQVWVTDGVMGHVPVSSNRFAVMVNALPSITSAPPAEVRAGEMLQYQVTIADPYPADDAHAFSLVEAPAGMRIDPQTGLVEWTPRDADVGTHAARIRVTDAYGGAAEQSFDLAVVAAPPPPAPGAWYFALGAGIAVALLGVGSAVSENLKWALLMVFIPLYSKIKREQVLDHFVRGQIYGYVLANPGEHYNAIKVALNLTNGSLAHHLKTLEREQFLKSKRFGLYRRFYPMHMRIPEDGFFAPNEIQKTIIDLIGAQPGITQKEIAQRLGLTPPTVNYHVGILAEHKQIRVDRAGRKTHCFVMDAGMSTAPSAPTGGATTGTPRPGAPRP